MTSKPRSQRLWYRTLHQIHLWVGIILCLPLVMLGITGSILVFEHEIEDLFDTAPAYALAAGEPKPISAIIDAARAAGPAGAVASMVMLPEEPGQPATVRMAARGGGAGGPGGPRGTPVPVDPVTLAVLESPAGGPGLLRPVFMLHANLLVSGRTGREIIGWFGVVMLGLGVTGLVMWWPRPGRWTAAFTVKRGASGARLHRELHGAVGIWSLAVFMVISFSGVYLAFPQTLGGAVSAVLPARDLRAPVTVSPVQGATPIGVDAVVDLARAAVADGRLRTVGLPVRPDQPYRITFTPPGHEHGAPMITVFIDPWTARVAEVRDPRDYSAGEVVMAWQHALHAGAGLGWIWKLLTFLSGFLPPLFVVTGIAMWLLKRRARRAQDAQRAAARAGASAATVGD